ncbi:MAG TPA: HAD family hydrolase [Geobacteraceae bacterium]|nr:HAD family hydrolase [Geobacteraceae bacterium]
MGQIAAIIFDLDGTLYTSRGLAAEIHRVACLALALQLGAGVGDAEERLAATKRTITSRTGREATLSAACEELGCDIRALHRYLAAEIVPEPFLQRDERVVAMLDRMSEAYSLYVYTNNNIPLSKKIMAAIGVERSIRKLFTIEYMWRSKPDRVALEGIYSIIGVGPGGCLFVGDRYDVDLRLPEEMGSRVFLTKTVDELLCLEGFVGSLRGDITAGDSRVCGNIKRGGIQ